MIIEVSPDMRRQEIWANGHELASIMGQDRSGGRRIYDYWQTLNIVMLTKPRTKK